MKSAPSRPRASGQKALPFWCQLSTATLPASKSKTERLGSSWSMIMAFIKAAHPMPKPPHQPSTKRHVSFAARATPRPVNITIPHAIPRRLEWWGGRAGWSAKKPKPRVTGFERRHGLMRASISHPIQKVMLKGFWVEALHDGTRNS